jgi:hypothetical protein
MIATRISGLPRWGSRRTDRYVGEAVAYRFFALQ